MGCAAAHIRVSMKCKGLALAVMFSIGPIQASAVCQRLETWWGRGAKLACVLLALADSPRCDSSPWTCFIRACSEKADHVRCDGTHRCFRYALPWDSSFSPWWSVQVIRSQACQKCSFLVNDFGHHPPEISFQIPTPTTDIHRRGINNWIGQK